MAMKNIKLKLNTNLINRLRKRVNAKGQTLEEYLTPLLENQIQVDSLPDKPQPPRSNE